MKNYKLHKLYNKKTLKKIKTFGLNNPGKGLPTKLWKLIYLDLGFEGGIVFQAFFANIEDNHFFVIEGARTCEEIVKLPIAEIMKFPKELQELIFFARKTDDYNKSVTFRGVAEVGGMVHMWKIHTITGDKK
ncbi:MAG: hypothetical protein V3V74_07655 [Nitrosomonadaceae bacterium]